jgi:hypothetical protein
MADDINPYLDGLVLAIDKLTQELTSIRKEIAAVTQALKAQKK